MSGQGEQGARTAGAAGSAGPGRQESLPSPPWQAPLPPAASEPADGGDIVFSGDDGGGSLLDDDNIGVVMGASAAAGPPDGDDDEQGVYYMVEGVESTPDVIVPPPPSHPPPGSPPYDAAEPISFPMDVDAHAHDSAVAAAEAAEAGAAGAAAMSLDDGDGDGEVGAPARASRPSAESAVSEILRLATPLTGQPPVSTEDPYEDVNPEELPGTAAAAAAAAAAATAAAVANEAATATAAGDAGDGATAGDGGGGDAGNSSSFLPVGANDAQDDDGDDGAGTPTRMLTSPGRIELESPALHSPVHVPSRAAPPPPDAAGRREGRSLDSGSTMMTEIDTVVGGAAGEGPYDQAAADDPDDRYDLVPAGNPGSVAAARPNTGDSVMSTSSGPLGDEIQPSSKKDKKAQVTAPPERGVSPPVAMPVAHHLSDVPEEGEYDSDGDANGAGELGAQPPRQASAAMPVSKLQRSSITASMRRNVRKRRTKSDARLSIWQSSSNSNSDREERERERDEHFQMLEDNAAYFQNDSVVADMSADAALTGHLEGVGPMHRDKHKMHSIMERAMTTHRRRKIAQKNSLEGGAGMSHAECVAMHAKGIKRLDQVRGLCIPMDEKLVLVQTLLLDLEGNEDALQHHSGVAGVLHLWWVGLRRGTARFFRALGRAITRNSIWHARIKSLEGRHGSNAGVFFRALKFIFMMNIIQVVILVAMVFIPFGIYFGWQAHTVLTPHGAYKAPGDFSDMDNAAGLFTGGGFMNTSWYFVGGFTVDYGLYPSDENASQHTVVINGTTLTVPGIRPVDNNYNPEVTYLLCAYAYVGIPLLFCFSALYRILRSVFSGVDDAPSDKATAIRFQLGKIIFASWEHSMTYETSVAMSQIVHANALRTVLYESHRAEEQARKNRFVLFSKRVVIEAVIIALIASGCAAVFYVTVTYSGSEDEREKLYPSLLLTAINAVYPDAFYLLGGFEDWHMATLSFLTLVRSQFMRVVTMYVYIFTLLQDRENAMCWESKIGDGFYTLFVIATISEILTSLTADFFLLVFWRRATGGHMLDLESDADKRASGAGGDAADDDDDDGWAARQRRQTLAMAREYSSPGYVLGKESMTSGDLEGGGGAAGGSPGKTGSSPNRQGSPGRYFIPARRHTSAMSAAVGPGAPSFLLRFFGPPSFNFKRHMVELVYQQSVLTFAMFFAPGLVFVALVRQFVNMYIKSWSTQKFCQPSGKGAHFAIHSLEAWVWMCFVIGILVSAVPLAYVLSVESLPCSGVHMPDEWQQKFFVVPDGWTAQPTCGRPEVFDCTDCLDNNRDITRGGCWYGGADKGYFNFTLAEVCALCPSGCGPFRNYDTPYSALIAASYDWPQGYQDIVDFLGTPIFGVIVFAVFFLVLVYQQALSQGRLIKIKRMQLEIEVHEQLINNNWVKNTTQQECELRRKRTERNRDLRRKKRKGQDIVLRDDSDDVRTTAANPAPLSRESRIMSIGNWSNVSSV